MNRYIHQEFIRACLVSYESLPKNVFHEGWGRPGTHTSQNYYCLLPYKLIFVGTKYSGIRFRRALLDTIPHIGMAIFKYKYKTSHKISIFCISDRLAHVVIPLHPSLKPHARMLHHFRFLKPLLPIDEDGMSPLHYYDSAIQLARNSARSLTEEEFETGMNAVQQIEKWSVCVSNSWMFC